MKPEQIHLGDWKRLLLGDAPWRFLPEVVLRTLLIYLALLAAMRVFGKRMTGQLTIVEMSVMLVLGAIVAVPMQVPDRGLLVGALLLFCVLLMQRGLGRLGFASRRVELLSQGDATLLVKDGVIQIGRLRDAALSHQQLYASLRDSEIHQLGEVRRLYLEACGEFSLFTFDEPRPGLCLLPGVDHDILAHCPVKPGLSACGYCGQVVAGSGKPERCDHCGHGAWVDAVE